MVLTDRFLHLSLVSFDLLLEFVDQIRQPFVVLLVLLLLELQLAYATILFAQILLHLRVAPLLSLQLGLQFPHLSK